MDNFRDLPVLTTDTMPDFLVGWNSQQGWGRIALDAINPRTLQLAKQMSGDDTPMLTIGGDHALLSWINNGMAKVYADNNVPPYIAVNTQDDAGEYVGAASRMTWPQVKQLQDDFGIEVVSHGSQHIQAWNLINTGIKLTYLGAGTVAIITVTGTWPAITIAATVTGAASDNFSFDTSNALYDTLAELKAAIEATNGGGKWTCRLSPELTGNELSNNILNMKGTQATTFSNSGGHVLATTTDDLPNASPVVFNGGVMPDSLTTLTTYWTIRISATTSKLATSRALALAGTPINYGTTNGSGTINMYQAGMIAKPWTAHDTVAANTCLLAVGGGITIQYTGTVYKTAYVNVLNSSVMEIYGDGVRVASYNLTLAANDTLRKLVTLISALTGFTAKLMDNDQATTYSNQSYVNGNESSARLHWCGGVDVIAKPTNFEVGLSVPYMIHRQLQETVDTAAANGVTINNFAQSGAAFYPHLQHGGQAVRSWRGNPLVKSSYAPLMVPCNERADYFHIVHSVSLTHTLAQMKAWIDALCDTRGHFVDLLIHVPSPDGTTGYNFPALVNQTASITEANFVELIRHIGRKVAAGSLRVLQPEQARIAKKLCPPPVNRILNPRFKNSGASVLGNASGDGVNLPGWGVFTPAGITAFTFNSDNTITLTSDGSSGAVDVIRQEHLLQAGKTYVFEFDIDMPLYTSGNGVALRVMRRFANIFKYMQPHTSNTLFTSDKRTRGGHMELKFTMPTRDNAGFAYVRSLTKGPWDLSAAGNAAMQVNLFAKGAIDNINVQGAVPATTHANEIATKLNAAITGNAAYAELQEYWTAFSAEDGYLVGRAPWRGGDNTANMRMDAATTNGGATAVVMGDAQVRGPNFQAQNIAAEDYPVYLTLMLDFIGTVRIRNPFLREEFNT